MTELPRTLTTDPAKREAELRVREMHAFLEGLDSEAYVGPTSPSARNAGTPTHLAVVAGSP